MPRPSKAITRADRERMGRAKEGICIPCWLRCAAGMLPAAWVQVGHEGTAATYWGLLDYHHTKSGNLRRGHQLGFAMCQWHHDGNQSQPPEGWTHRMLRDRYGPSLACGSALFHATYGTDDELIAIQTAYLNGEITP